MIHALIQSMRKLKEFHQNKNIVLFVPFVYTKKGTLNELNWDSENL